MNPKISPHFQEPVNITLFRKRVCTDTIKLGVLTWGDHPRSSRWALILLQVFLQERGRRRLDRDTLRRKQHEEGRDDSDADIRQGGTAASRS